MHVSMYALVDVCVCVCVWASKLSLTSKITDLHTHWLLS